MVGVFLSSLWPMHTNKYGSLKKNLSYLSLWSSPSITSSKSSSSFSMTVERKLFCTIRTIQYWDQTPKKPAISPPPQNPQNWTGLQGVYFVSLVVAKRGIFWENFVLTKKVLKHKFKTTAPRLMVRQKKPTKYETTWSFFLKIHFEVRFGPNANTNWLWKTWKP